MQLLGDNRTRQIFEIEEYPEFSDFDEFNTGNPIKAFFWCHFFFVFEKKVNLLDALHQYMERVARESPAGNVPLQGGTQIICHKLEDLVNRKSGKEALDEIEIIAEHVKDTSLCGLGQTATVDLLQALASFREELVTELAAPSPSRQQQGLKFAICRLR